MNSSFYAVLVGQSSGVPWLPPSVLEPAGSPAALVAQLWWVFFCLLLMIYAVVVLCALWAVRGAAGRSPANEPLLEPPPGQEQRMRYVVAGAVGLTSALLFGFLMADLFSARAEEADLANPELKLRIIGHQWWWEVKYDAARSSETVTTANEVHLPVGRVVELTLSSLDVIHSFWVPNLTGKKDLIPGHPTTLSLRAERAGYYLGQCAEFCGVEHAKMRLLVVAEPEARYQEWLASQRESPPAPMTPAQQRGSHFFASSSCALCHTVGGTPARATVGPNLSHFASRQMLAGNTLPNRRGYLAGWILDPQHLKPGVKMPQHTLAAEDLHALLDYLETLK